MQKIATNESAPRINDPKIYEKVEICEGLEKTDPVWKSKKDKKIRRDNKTFSVAPNGENFSKYYEFSLV